MSVGRNIMVMSETQRAAVPAGWYDDGSGVKRWWDGQQWTATAAEPAKRKLSGVAVAGFIVGTVGAILFLVPVLGVVLLVAGILLSAGGMWDTKRNNLRGYGFAVAGLIISVSVLASIIILFSLVQ